MTVAAVSAPIETQTTPSTVQTGQAGTIAPVNAPAASPAVAAAATSPAVAPVAKVAAPIRLLGDDATAPVAAAETAVAAAAPAKAEAPTDWTIEAPKDVTIAADDLKAVETFSKENGLTKVQAEKVLSRDIAARAALTAKAQADVESIGATWHAEAQKHPEIGGDKLAGAVANANKALAKYATPEERAAIKASPFANNPLFIAILNRAARGLPQEDTMHVDAGAAASERPMTAEQAAQRMYAKKKA